MGEGLRAGGADVGSFSAGADDLKAVAGRRAGLRNDEPGPEPMPVACWIPPRVNPS